jgi:flagellar biosynthesis protein FlhB
MAEEKQGEKTEEPTTRRLEEARRRGEVAQSRDLVGAAVFLTIFAVLTFNAASWTTGLIVYMRSVFSLIARPDALTWHMSRALTAMSDALLPPLLAALAVAVAVGFLQTRAVWSWEALRPDLKKVMPDWKRVVSGAALVEIVKGFLKILLTGAVVWLAMAGLIRSLAALAGASPRSVLRVLGYTTSHMAVRIGLVVVAVGVLDYLWQWHQHRKRLKMTREEVKREYKESEGDPQHKAERTRLHRQILEQRMIDAVRRADFVVVNPDHIAVAIRYDKDAQHAPLVVAKGERLLAERIKEAAREAGVPIFRDVTLARALREVEEGDEIPEALYQAVAEILRVVFGPATPTGAPPAAAPPPRSPPPGAQRL